MSIKLVDPPFNAFLNVRQDGLAIGLNFRLAAACYRSDQCFQIKFQISIDQAIERSITHHLLRINYDGFITDQFWWLPL